MTGGTFFSSDKKCKVPACKHTTNKDAILCKMLNDGGFAIRLFFIRDDV